MRRSGILDLGFILTTLHVIGRSTPWAALFLVAMPIAC